MSDPTRRLWVVRNPIYQPSILHDAVASTTCMTELLTKLGVEITPGRRSAMWARLGQMKIDTSHWVRSSHARRLYQDEDLAVAVAQCICIAGVLRQLGIKQAGGSHAHIRRRIDLAGLDTSHFLGPASRRGLRSPRRSAADILIRLPEGSGRPRRHLLVRAMLESGVVKACAECGTGPMWRGARLCLAVDHIDGDWLNNILGNLRILCPNCHSQTATWCRRKGS